MKKKRLLTAIAILFCLGIAGMVSAREVISIDLNYAGNKIAYSGKGAVDGNYVQVWRAYDGNTVGVLPAGSTGWGKAMGSPRTGHLADYNEPNKPSVCAAQVWISDMNTGTYPSNVHGWFGSSAGTGLLSDGFVKTGGSSDPDPYILLWGIDAYGKLGPSQNYPNPPNDSAIIPYPGDPNYDIYVYGPEAGNFTLTCSQWPSSPQTKSIIGGGSDGSFTEGTNYVVFSDVPVSAWLSYDHSGDAQAVTISYSKKISGLQLVKRRDPVEIVKSGNTVILARAYDVAYSLKRRAGEGGPTIVTRSFGPDTWEVNNLIVNLDRREEMTYDINVSQANEGLYQVDVNLTTRQWEPGVPAGGLGDGEVWVDLFFDDVNVGSMYRHADYTWPPQDTGAPITVKLFQGPHHIMWRAGSEGFEPRWGIHMYGIKFHPIAGVLKMDDCNDVFRYGYGYAQDFATHNCHVDFNDLAVITANWLKCYDPNGICP